MDKSRDLMTYADILHDTMSRGSQEVTPYFFEFLSPKNDMTYLEHLAPFIRRKIKKQNNQPHAR